MAISDGMGSFYRDVVKVYNEHSGPNEFVTFHGPENHGNHGEHCQLTFVNRDAGAGMIRIPTDSCLG
jgi:hypothetical protein